MTIHCRANRWAKLAPVMMLAAVPALSASTDQWTNAAGGDWSAGGNWTLNAPPRNSDQADFLLNDTFGVSFSSDVTAYQMLVDAGQVTFDLGGHTANFPSSPGGQGIVIAQSSNSVASLTIGNGTLSTNECDVGVAGASLGTLNIGVGGHLVIHSSATQNDKLNLGEESHGTLNVSGGGQATVDVLQVGIGPVPSPRVPCGGQITVTDAGSSLTVNQFMYLGQDAVATASLVVQKSGTVTINQFYIAYGSGATATATVDDATVNAHHVTAGAQGNGQLTIQNGGSVAAVPNFLGVGQIDIGYMNGGNGLITISGAGSTLTSSGDLNIAVTYPLNPGDHSSGELKVIGGGPTIQVARNFNMGVDQPVLADTIDATGIAPIKVSGTASLDGKLVVELGNYAPLSGQVYRILTANGGITGSLTLSGPEASQFTIDQGPTTLDVVYTGAPEPSSLGLIGLAAAALVLPRRRSKARY